MVALVCRALPPRRPLRTRFTVGCHVKSHISHVPNQFRPESFGPKVGLVQKLGALRVLYSNKGPQHGDGCRAFQDKRRDDRTVSSSSTRFGHMAVQTVWQRALRLPKARSRQVGPSSQVTCILSSWVFNNNGGII